MFRSTLSFLIKSYSPPTFQFVYLVICISVTSVLTILSLTDLLLIEASATNKSLNLFLQRHFRSNGLSVELLDTLRADEKIEELDTIKVN